MDKITEHLIAKNFIKVIHTSTMTPLTYFDAKQFIIEIPDRLAQEDVEKAIYHEMAHIIRMDMLHGLENHKLANLCQDIIINTVLNIRKLCIADKDVEGYHWDLVKDQQGIPHWTKGYKALYEYFERNSDFQDYRPDTIPVAESDVANAKEIASEIRKEIITSNESSKLKDCITRIVEIELNKSLKLPEIHNKAGNSDSYNEYVTKISRKDPYLMKLAKKLISETGISHQTKTIQRTYRRESIVPGFARRMPLPSRSIMFIIDGSGSYIDIAEKYVLPAILYVHKRIPVRVITFDTKVYEVKASSCSLVYKGGGGTLLKPVLDYLSKNNTLCSAIIFISDYEFFDTNIKRHELQKALHSYARKVFCIDYTEVTKGGQK